MSEHPRPRRTRSQPKIDPALSKNQEAILHMPPGLMGRMWQDMAGCDRQDCPVCRLGRALAWTAKATADIALSVTVARDVLSELPTEQPDPAFHHEQFNEDLAAVAISELTQAGEEVAYWAMTLGHACGAKVIPSKALDVNVVDEDDMHMLVEMFGRGGGRRKAGTPGEPTEEPKGRAN